MRKNLAFLFIPLLLQFCKSNLHDKESFGSNNSVSGNWYILIDMDTSIHESDIDRYEEVYFSQEFFYFNDIIGIGEPSRYALRSDSVVVEDNECLFVIKEYYEDSMLVQFSGELNLVMMNRLDTIERPFSEIVLSPRELERLSGNKVKRAVKLLGY